MRLSMESSIDSQHERYYYQNFIPIFEIDYFGNLAF